MVAQVAIVGVAVIALTAEIVALESLADGDEFQVNTYTTGMQVRPAVAVDADDDFVVVWKSAGSSGSDTDDTSVQGQRFADPAIFADGFESGDTAAWSSTVQ